MALSGRGSVHKEQRAKVDTNACCQNGKADRLEEIVMPLYEQRNQ